MSDEAQGSSSSVATDDGARPDQQLEHLIPRRPLPSNSRSNSSARPHSETAPTQQDSISHPRQSQGSPTQHDNPNVERQAHVSPEDSSSAETLPEKARHHEYTTYEKCGAVAVTILGVGLISILAAIGFLWFLWLAGYRNSTWHKIVSGNWLASPSVSLSATLLRQAISFQAGTAASMLASVALEQFMVLLLHVASVSVTRNANAGPYMLLWYIFKAFLRNSARRWRSSWLMILVLLLTLTTLFLQFTSTVLLSDLRPSIVPGLSTSSRTATNFAYDVNGSIPIIRRGTTWTMKPPFYPTFAEYHEPPPATPEGVVDTGVTLRAFMPIQDQQSRSLLRNYEGRATVLDARVQCMRPDLSSERLHITDGVLGFEGVVKASFNTSRLIFIGTNTTADDESDSANDYGIIHDWELRPNTSFGCLSPLQNTNLNDDYHTNNASLAESDDNTNWRLSFCQPTESQFAGQLTSEFQTPEWELRYPHSSPYMSFGALYIAVNVSNGGVEDWMNVLSNEEAGFGGFVGPGMAPLLYSAHGEWLDLFFTPDGSLKLSISMCYAAFDTADRNVTISSTTNRTEPSPSYNDKTFKYTYSRVRQQLGQPNTLSPHDSDTISERGIMSLHKRSSWLGGPGDYQFKGNTLTEVSWVMDFANMAGPMGSSQTANSDRQNYTGLMFNALDNANTWSAMPVIVADPSLYSMVQEIVQTGGDIAFALQSVLTTLTGIAYYDQLQQFNDVSTIKQKSFVVATAPKRFRGLIAVTSVATAHLVITAIILWLFLSKTRVSSIGNSWQAVAQVRAPMTEELLSESILGRDKAVEEILKTNKWKRRIVGIRLTDDGLGTELVEADVEYKRIANSEPESERPVSHASASSKVESGNRDSPRDREEDVRESAPVPAQSEG